MADYNINAVTRRTVQSGSVGLGPYNFTFEILTQTDIDVYFNQTLLTLTTDYTVTINANGTGSITIVTGTNVPSTPDSNDSITIIGARNIERTTDFVTAGDLTAASLNEQLDALTIFDQQISERVDRSIQFPSYEPSGLSYTVPAVDSRKNKYLAFDGNGELTTTEGTTSNVIVSAYAQTLLDDADAASARATLGLGTISTLSSISTSNIDDNAINATKLNISGNGTSGQYVTSDGDGSFSYTTPPSVSSFASGMLMPYAGATAPSGWLLCYGQAISRTTYADLFAALGTTYGVGDGSTTFNLPDLRGRTIAGQDDMGGASANRLTNQTGGLDGDTLGATGGAETHTLTTDQMPSHAHSGVLTGSSTGDRYQTTTSSSAPRPITSTSSGSTGSTGGGQAHNNVQPTIILNYIIKE